MANGTAPLSLPFGLLELDPSGTVLYFKPEGDGSSTSQAADLTGCNLFADVPALAAAEEFRERLHGFRRNHAPADSFTYTFPSEQGFVRAKILLARIREQSSLGSIESILIHIREAS
jgi:hypothetical protein